MTLQELVTKHSHPELADKPGHVWQVWQDGEVTLQKSGELLWQRILHMIYPGFTGFDAFEVTWPHTNGTNKYIFTTEEGAKEIHRYIANLLGKFHYCS